MQTKGLTAILTEMHEKIGGNVEAINKILGNIRAMRAGVSLTGKQFSNFIDVLEQAKAEIGTGVSMEAFTKQTATAKQALENFKTQLDKTFIGIGKDEWDSHCIGKSGRQCGRPFFCFLAQEISA